MENVFLTIEEFLAITTDNHKDQNGKIVLSEEGAAAILKAAQRAQRNSKRKPRADLKDLAILDKYKIAMIIEMKNNPGISMSALSKSIGLGKNTISNNPVLHALYSRMLAGVSNTAPATVDNDKYARWNDEE